MRLYIEWIVNLETVSINRGIMRQYLINFYISSYLCIYSISSSGASFSIHLFMLVFL